MVMTFITDNSAELTAGSIALLIVAAGWFARAASQRTRSKRYLDKLIAEREQPYEQSYATFTFDDETTKEPAKV